jgi:uncharacterized protein YggE
LPSRRPRSPSKEAPPRFIGYQVSNAVRVTTVDIDNLGSLLDALVAAGGTNIDGPYFSMKDADAQLVPARSAALQEAEAKAADYARIAGYRSAELVAISEGGSAQGPGPVLVAYAADVATRSKAVVEPGQVGNMLTLNVQYRLVR